MKRKTNDTIRYALGASLTAVAAVLILNSVLLMQVQAAAFPEQGQDGIIPTGTPDTYGKELGIRYDDVSASDPGKADATIAQLAQLDRSLEVDGALKERYVNILYKMHGGISCEYCCNARSVIFENGEAACGCAHSYAMRGLTKYLLTEHPEMTDEEIFAEVGKWKTLFFPTQITTKADALEAKGIEVTYETLTSNEYRGLADGRGGMVGGC